jgi:hypothetical protein
MDLLQVGMQPVQPRRRPGCVDKNLVKFSFFFKEFIANSACLFCCRRGAQVLVPAVSIHDAKEVAARLAHANAHGGAAAHVLHLRPGLPGEEPPGAPRAHPPRGQTL